jgi:hypothetical protein
MTPAAVAGLRTPRQLTYAGDAPEYLGAMFDTKELPAIVDAVAPDGSDVRILLGLAGGGLAHFAS